jgi:hypothetical protein
MEIKKTAQIILNHEEIWWLKQFVSVGSAIINDCLRMESTRLGYSFSDMQQMAELARRLEDL